MSYPGQGYPQVYYSQPPPVWPPPPQYQYPVPPLPNAQPTQNAQQAQQANSGDGEDCSTMLCCCCRVLWCFLNCDPSSLC
ncbi:hypothetical protein SUGI_0244770 [Cryptomeria japonica]|nr:hypothetical protein SUGI_0244770 [Cryptomeria japonica]